MTMRQSEIAMIGAAGACALLVPLWLLWPRALPPLPEAGAITVHPAPAPELADLGERHLFSANGGMAGSALPPDAPELTGIVGRPPHDAVALIRTTEGTTRTLAPGQSYAGWQLEAVSAEAALFSRGPLQIRVPMPAPEPVDDQISSGQ